MRQIHEDVQQPVAAAEKPFEVEVEPAFAYTTPETPKPVREKEEKPGPKKVDEATFTMVDAAVQRTVNETIPADMPELDVNEYQDSVPAKMPEIQRPALEKEKVTAKEAAESAAEAADAAAESFENLKNGLDSLSNKYDGLDKLTRGTKEWNEAVQDINSSVLDLVDQYPELAKFVENKEGVLTIDVESDGV
jgi:uncharacterized phage infection (PIP) family protein YhgE